MADKGSEMLATLINVHYVLAGIFNMALMLFSLQSSVNAIIDDETETQSG